MAVNDYKIQESTSVTMPTRVYQTNSNTTAINPGEPVVLTTIGTSVYAAAAGDGTPVIGTDYFVGIASKASTQTSTAVGTVEVYSALPGVVYRGKAKSSTAANTAAKILALANKRVVFDLTSSTYTVDTAAADGSTNGIILTGTGDALTNSVDFIVSIRTTNLGF